MMTKAFVKVMLAIAMLGLVVLARPATSAAAGMETYVQIPGIDGESTAKGHEKWIAASAFQLGLTSPRDAASGMATGKVQMTDVTITTTFDKATPKLFQAAASGERFQKVIIDMAGPTSPAGIPSTIRVTLEDVAITGLHIATGTSGVLAAHASLHFSKITWDYNNQSGAQSKAGWDVKSNQKI